MSKRKSRESHMTVGQCVSQVCIGIHYRPVIEMHQITEKKMNSWFCVCVCVSIGTKNFKAEILSPGDQ